MSEKIPDSRQRVGKYFADYSGLTLEEVSAADPYLEGLIVGSQVVSTKAIGDSTPDTAPSMREGDIYRWRWADPKRDADCGPFRSYHCLSQWAVVRDGKLTDTYWHGLDNRVLDPAEVILTFIGNTADLVEIRAYDIPYYRREDIVDMRHINNSYGPIYLRKGAQKDADTMLAVIKERLELRHQEIASAQRDVERLTEDTEKVHAGKLDEVYL